MKLVKQIGYKLIVTLCIVMTFCCFIASAPVEASKVSTGDFYYAGTTKGTYTVNKGFLEKLIDALGEILDYLIGLLTMGVRIVFVGWTVLFERCLTWILEGATGENVDIDNASSTAMSPPDEVITLEAIFFNRVPLLDINVFDMTVRTDVSPLGEELEPEGEPTSQIVVQGQHNNMTSNNITTVQGEKSFFYAAQAAQGQNSGDDSLVMILKKTIATWYYTFRVISIMIMLVLLVFIGVKLAIQSAATEKALYKQVLVDWLVGMILVFSIHYIMLFIIEFNEILLEQISKFMKEDQTLEVYEYGLIERAETPPTNVEIENSMYEEVRTRAYDARMTVGFTGMAMYMVLVFYAWKYTFIYLKRYLTIAILVMIAPIVALTYAFNKVMTGKSQIFTGWLKEFSFTVILQSVHALLYVVFVDTAIALSLSSIAGMIIAFVSLHFLGKAEQIFRKIFNLSGKFTDDIATGNILATVAAAKAGAKKGVALGMGASKVALRATTKPIRMAGNAAFGGIMQARANGTFSKNKNLVQRRNDYETRSKTLDTEEAEKKKNGRVAGELLANNVTNLMSAVRHPFAKNKRNRKATIKDLENDLETWRSLKGQTWTDEDGEEHEITDEFIEAKEEELNQAKDVNNHKLLTFGRYLSSSTRGTLRDILDPYQYVEQGEDGKYHMVKTKREKGVFSKKKDSVGKRFLANFKIEEEFKKSLKPQLHMLNNQLAGFFGILVGLPALVAEPKIGAGLLYIGISKTNKVFGKSQNFKDVKMIPAGQRFTLKGFAGSSQATIADAALDMAREQLLENDEAITEQHNRVVKTVKKKRCAGNLSVGSSSSGGYKVVKLNNLQASYVNTLRVVNKINKKADEKQFKDADEFLEALADQYYQMEADKHKAEFSNLYSTIQEQQEAEVDAMSIDEVKRELGYQEEIKVEKQPDGTVRLAGNLENTIIDNAIVESAQKRGIMDIGEFALSSENIEQVKISIVRELREKKVISKSEDVSGIIEDLDNKIKNRQAKLAVEGTKPVEEKIAEQAIIETMKDGNITEPEKVSSEAVMEKYQEIYAVTAGEPTKKTTSVTEQMQAEKPKASTEDSASVRKVVDEERAKQIISARKTHLSNISKDTAESDELRAELKRRKEAELDAVILEKEEALNTSTVTETMLGNDNTTDSVLQLLNYQTQMHKSYELVEARTQSKEDKLKAFKAEIFEESGSIRRDKKTNEVILRDGRRIAPDGSRMAKQTDGTRRIEDLLIDSKKRRK